jgi:hypothetical protein
VLERFRLPLKPQVLLGLASVGLDILAVVARMVTEPVPQVGDLGLALIMRT